LIAYLDAIKSEAPTVWAVGSGDGGGLTMNDGITVCMNVLRSVFAHLSDVNKINLPELDDHELAEVTVRFGTLVGKYFSSLSIEQMKQFRALRGVQGQTTGTRKVEQFIKMSVPTFDPPGLSDFITRAKSETTKQAFDQLHKIETLLQKYVLAELKAEYGEDEQGWWFNGVPKNVRKRIDDRINEEAGKKGGREANFDLIDYRSIILENWSLFEKMMSQGKSGNKEARTKWLQDANDLRKPVMHASKGQSLPITEEQLNQLVQTGEWLEARITGQNEEE
jgi:hypothetical protein